MSPPIEGTKTGEQRDDNQLQMKFVWIPPGKFLMGSPKDEAGRIFNEEPVAVTLSTGFWLGQHEVTQSEWFRLMKTRPWDGTNFEVAKGDDHPAIYVAWEEATQFCQSLIQQERNAGRLPKGWKYVLPTEAQWEYACRAGTTTRYSFGNDVSKLDEYAWYSGNTIDMNDKYIHQVGRKKPNP
ncbi:MAG: formylglycine-generating enzyme family protein, partial [Planctomycetaceae bacterium]